MCNNSLFKNYGAENVPGLSVIPKMWLSFIFKMKLGVGEHFNCCEALAARRCGAIGRENVGMSNHYPNEKLGPRKSKVSVPLAIKDGLGGPKPMAKAEGDG